MKHKIIEINGRYYMTAGGVILYEVEIVEENKNETED